MDARASRTATALREAVVRLATARPIDEVSAVDLVTEAGVTRRTLYNHTSSPQQLLVDILRPELEAVAKAFRSRLATGMSLTEAWSLGDEDLAEHLLRWAGVYGAGVHGPSDHLPPSLAHLLSDTFEKDMLDLLAQLRPTDPDPLLTARFIGHGVVGAIEAWLTTTERDPARLVDGVLRSLPAWIPSS